ncbi:hypothetical protein ABPG72_001482 [Tetrahymena utriculariae]
MSKSLEDKNQMGLQLVDVNQKNYQKKQIDESQYIQISEDEQGGDQAILISSKQDNKKICFQIKKVYRNTLDFLKKYSKQTIGVVSVIFSILVLASYFSLKEKCPYDSDHTCLKQFIFPKLFVWICKVLFNSLATVIQFHILISKSTYTLIPAYGFLQSFYLFIFNDNTINLHYYMGGINAIHIIIIAFLLLVYGLIRIWVACFKKYKWICFFGNLSVILTVLILFYYQSILHGCDYWTKGINGQIESQQSSCNILLPKYCWYKITHQWQDLSLLFPTCENASTSQNQKLKIDQFFSPYVNSSQFIAFKNLNSIPEKNRTDEEIQATAFRQSKGYSSLEQAFNDQYDVVFDRKEQKYHIDVQFNKTLSEERKKIANENPSKPLSKNILIIFIDAISRQSMHLKLPKTVEWFEKRSRMHSYVPENKQSEEDKKKSQSFEFYKYNSLKPYTYDNLQNLMYGQYVRDVEVSEEEKLVSIVEDIKQKGYVTGHSSDQCQTLSLSFDYETFGLINSSRYDHETQSYACDPNFQDPESKFGLFQGPYSIVRRCLYGKTMAEYPLDYAKSFFKKYKDNQKFMHLEFSYGHEGTGEVINYLDDPLSRFLENMTDEGLLKDTTVILLSDHGLHMQGIFYLLQLKNVFIEINLPGLFINIPPELNEKYGDQIALNQQSLVSVKNLHHFIKQIIVGEEYENYKQSLFNHLQFQKQCHDIGVFDSGNCSCK